MNPQEVITRRRLPHWYVPGAVHFVTYRLAGTIPGDVLRAWREIQPVPTEGAEPRRVAHKQLFARYDDYLDRNVTVDWLARPAIAAIIKDNLHHHDGVKYHLVAYCIMPNHVHALFQPLAPLRRGAQLIGETADAGSPLSDIMHSLKSYTANKANAALGRRGTFWQAESYDHWARDDDEVGRIVDYINGNPVKANLCARPHEWPHGSAGERFLLDGDLSGVLAAPELA